MNQAATFSIDTCRLNRLWPHNTAIVAEVGFVTAARCCRTTCAKIGTQTLPIKPLPNDLREALDMIDQAAR